MLIPLDVCCNNPDNGLFDECAAGLSILDMEFDPRAWSAPRFIELDDGIRLSGKNWPVAGSKDWYGNWCWNRYWIGDARRAPGWWMTDFLIWLKRRELFTCVAGPPELFEWFNGEREASPAEVHGWLGDMWQTQRAAA